MAPPAGSSEFWILNSRFQVWMGLPVVLRRDAPQLLPDRVTFPQHVFAQRRSLARFEVFLELLKARGSQDHAVDHGLAEEPAEGEGDDRKAGALSNCGNLLDRIEVIRMPVSVLIHLVSVEARPRRRSFV